MRAQLKHIQRDLETTTIYVTHDQIEAMTLADRIAIMNKGKIQQLGTPDEVYNDPNHIFVAGFIGSPPMNLIKGSLEKGTFTGPDTQVKNLGKASNKNVVLGIRPEDMEISPAKGGNFVSKLYSLEPTGDQTLVAAWAGEQLVVAKGHRTFRQSHRHADRLHLPQGPHLSFRRRDGRTAALLNAGLPQRLKQRHLLRQQFALLVAAHEDLEHGVACGVQELHRA